MRVLLKAPMNPHSGYGNDGIGMALALRQAGCDVYLDPLHVQAPLPPEIAELLTKRLQPPFDLYLHHVDPGQLGISDAARRNAAVTVAWTMWEYSSLRNLAGRSTLRKRLKDYDLVVGYDTVSSEALQPYVSTRAASVQGGFWPQDWPHFSGRDWNGPLRFCMVGALGPRKDPFVAIDAFRELREEHPELDIELSLKTVTPGLHSKMQTVIPGLRIFYETWDADTLRAFYAQHHVLLAPSRGEGKNMPALEMMSTGGTVIATNWGGHRQWLSPTVGYPLDLRLEPVTRSVPDCQWAKADKDHLKRLMLRAYENRDELARKGDIAAELIPAMCSWPKAMERLMNAVAGLGDTGQRIVSRYRSRVEQQRLALL